MPLLVLEDLHSAGPLLTLAIVILVGMLSGAVARRMHLPGITGQILAGIALGAAGFNIFGEGEHGDAEAQSRVGLSYYLGSGTEQDFGEAVVWFRRAAEQGHAVGQTSSAPCMRMSGA